MLEQAEDMTGARAEVSLADADYHSGVNLVACEQREQKIIMPESQKKALQNPYHKDRFIYDNSSDSYLCPHNQTLRFTRVKRTRETMMRLYRASGAVCLKCPAFGICTVDHRHGRAIEVGPQDAALRRHRELMATEEAKAAFRRRKELPEPVFGIIKEQMGFRRFLLRGLHNVKAEANMIVTAFNLRTLYRVWQKGLGKISNMFMDNLGMRVEDMALEPCPPRPMGTMALTHLLTSVRAYGNTAIARIFAVNHFSGAT